VKDTAQFTVARTVEAADVELALGASMCVDSQATRPDSTRPLIATRDHGRDLGIM
jgi:hypothetical protein